MTRKAQENLETGDLRFEPETSPVAHRVGKVSLKDDRAEVSLIPINDVGEDSKESLRLRKESGEWRVYAMAFRQAPSGPAMVFDFENPNALFEGMVRGLEQAMDDLGTGEDAAVEAERVSAITAMDRAGFDDSWKIDLDVQGRPAGDVLEELLGGLDLELERAPGIADALAQPVTLRLAGRSRLEAVEEVCRQIGVHPVYPRQSPSRVELIAEFMEEGLKEVFEMPDGGKLQSRPEPPAPSVTFKRGSRPLPAAFAGPFLIEVREVKEFPPDATGSLKLRASAFGLPPGLVTLSAERARDLLTMERALASGTENLFDKVWDWEPVGQTRSSLQLELDRRLRGLYRAVTTLETVEGKVTLPVPTRVVSLRFDDLQQGETKTEGDVELVLRNVNEGESTFTFNNRRTTRKRLNLHFVITGADHEEVKLLPFDRHDQPLEVFSLSSASEHPGGSFKNIQVDGEPAYVIATIIPEIEHAKYPFELTEIPLKSFAQQPEGIQPLEFAGHEAPVSVEVLGLGRDRLFGRNPPPGFNPQLRVNVRVTNHSNKDVTELTLLCTYFDAAGEFLDQKREPASGTHNLDTDRIEPLAAKGATNQIQVGIFLPEGTEKVTALVEKATFADRSEWEADPAYKIAALIAKLKAPEPRDRRWAIRDLGKLGPSAAEAVPVLQAALQDSDQRVRESAAQALEKIGAVGPETNRQSPAADSPRTAKASGPHNKPFVPVLLAPTSGTIMDNGRTDQTDGIVWDFEWSDVPGATDYHLVVQRRGAQRAMIDTNVQGAMYRHESPQSYIAGSNTRGWRWKVRARVDGAWKDWSESRSFRVEPVNTDRRR